MWIEPAKGLDLTKAVHLFKAAEESKVGLGRSSKLYKPCRTVYITFVG